MNLNLKVREIDRYISILRQKLEDCMPDDALALDQQIKALLQDRERILRAKIPKKKTKAQIAFPF